MPATITRITAYDIRFPTSRHLDGSDAMNQAPDYSAAYALVETDEGDGPVGHGMTFTIGRGNEVCVKAIESLAPLVVGRTLEDITADMGAFWRSIAGDSQLRWIGPEKGAIHLATAAVVNGLWDLWAKAEGKPVWKLLADMTPEQVVRCIDFRHVTDALTPAEALEILGRNAPTKGEREREMLARSYPAYTTSAGSATPTRSCVGSAARVSPAAGRTSSRRLAATSRTTCAGRGSSARRSAVSAH
jgi:L-fuconate dehydratase